MAEFITVATTDEVKPGDRIVVEIGRKWIAVFNVDGKYYAIQDICPHDDASIAEGELEGCVIECPRHGATFDIATGKVLSAPALVDIRAFEVRVEAGAIQVAVE